MRAGTAQVGMTCGVHWRIRGLILLLLTLVWHPSLTSGFQGRLGRARVSTPLPMALAGGQQSFNPFSSRNRNKNIQWFEADLETFYRFVEQQPLLTNEQEIKYGRALRMWQKVEELREKMQLMKLEQDDAEAAALEAEAEAAEAAANAALAAAGVTTVERDLIDGSNGYGEASGTDVIEASTDRKSTRDNNKKTKKKTKKELAQLAAYDRRYAVTYEELGEVLNCSVEKLAKIQQYHEAAKERLVNSNLKLVLAVVSRYRSSNIPNAELIAEGTRGLSRAALRYDYSKGFRFATYATWYVHQAVYEYVRWRKHPAKMPSRYLLLQRKVKDYQRVFQQQEGRVPSPSEISEALDLSRFDVSKVLTMQLYPMLLQTTVNYKGGSYKQEGKERTYEEFLPTNSDLPSDYNKDLREEMESMMRENLNQVERDVLRLRLGLDNGRPKAVKEVGRRFKISWKDVRNVEKEAIAKLKDSKEISDFIESYQTVEA